VADGECKAGLLCIGTCKPPTPIGGRCDVTRECVEEAFCPGGVSPGGGTCTPKLAVGTPCDELSYCAKGAVCGRTTKVCVVEDDRGAWPGQPCNEETSTRCLFGMCSGRSASGDQPGVCPPLAAPDGVCSDVLACPEGTCVNGACTSTIPALLCR